MVNKSVVMSTELHARKQEAGKEIEQLCGGQQKLQSSWWYADLPGWGHIYDFLSGEIKV